MNQELQNDYKHFGNDNFAFEILDYLEPKDDINYDYTDDFKSIKRNVDRKTFNKFSQRV